MKLNYKYVSLVLILTLISLQMFSQTTLKKERPKGAWNAGSKILSFGYGYNANVPFMYDPKLSESTHIYTLTTRETVYGAHAKADFSYGHFGIGLSLNRSAMILDYIHDSGNYVDSVKVYEIVQNINFRANYHFLLERVIDPYIGFGAGLRVVNARSGGNNIPVEDNIPVGIEATIGLRCLILSRVGIYGEYGFGRTQYQVGLSINVGKAPVKRVSGP